jgi:hypothetical protein
MPTLAQVQNIAGNRLNALFNGQLSARQAPYLTANGHFFQGTRTSALPVNLNNASPTVTEIAPDLTQRPRDRPHRWADFGAVLGATIPFALELHVYQGPQGRGWVAIASLIWNSQRWIKTRQSGPETSRERDWRLSPLVIP